MFVYNLTPVKGFQLTTMYNNGYRIRGYIDRGKLYLVNLGCLFIGQFVYLVEVEGLG